MAGIRGVPSGDYNYTNDDRLAWKAYQRQYPRSVSQTIYSQGQKASNIFEAYRSWVKKLRGRKEQNKAVRLAQIEKAKLMVLASTELDFDTVQKIHSVDYSNKIGMRYLAELHNQGYTTKIKGTNTPVGVPARPLLDNFKKTVKVHFPTRQELKRLDIETIIKNLEDEMDLQWRNAQFRFEPLSPKYIRRSGRNDNPPLKRTGQLWANIRWKLYPKLTMANSGVAS